MIAVKSLLDLAIGSFENNKYLSIIITARDADDGYYIFLKKARYKELVMSILDEMPQVACVNTIEGKRTDVIIFSVILLFPHDVRSCKAEHISEILDEAIGKRKGL